MRLNQCFPKFSRLSTQKRNVILSQLKAHNSDQLHEFFGKIELSLSRKITSIVVYPLHGLVVELNSAQAAYEFLASYNEGQENLPVARYEIIVKFSNGDKIEAQYHEKQRALFFLKEYI